MLVQFNGPISVMGSNKLRVYSGYAFLVNALRDISTELTVASHEIMQFSRSLLLSMRPLSRSGNLRGAAISTGKYST